MAPVVWGEGRSIGWWSRRAFSLLVGLYTLAQAVGMPSNLLVWARCYRHGGSACDPLIDAVGQLPMMPTLDVWRIFNIALFLVCVALLLPDSLWHRLARRFMSDVLYTDPETGRKRRLSEISAMTQEERDDFKRLHPSIFRKWRGRLWGDIVHQRPKEVTRPQPPEIFVHDGLRWKLLPEFFRRSQSIDQLDREIVDACILGPFCPVCDRNLWVPDRYGEYTIDRYEPKCPTCQYPCPPRRTGEFLATDAKRDAFKEAQRLISQGISLSTTSSAIALWIKAARERTQRDIAEFERMLQEGVRQRDSLRKKRRRKQPLGSIAPASPVEPIAYDGYEMDAWSGQVIGKLKAMRQPELETYFLGCNDIAPAQERAACYLERLAAIIEQLREKSTP